MFESLRNVEIINENAFNKNDFLVNDNFHDAMIVSVGVINQGKSGMNNPTHATQIVDIDFLINKLRFAGRSEISPERFANAFDYELLTLERLAHVDPLHAKDWRMSPQLQSFMENALKVMGSAALLLTDMDEAKTWFKNYRFAEFADKTPEQLVSDGQHALLFKKLSVGEQSDRQRFINRTGTLAAAVSYL